MRYPPEFIDRVQEASSLSEVIGQYTALKPSGGGYMGRCPFPDHQEKTASFSVSEAKQVYHCFGCKKSGNIFTFLRDYNGMSFPEALEYLADRGGIPIPELAQENRDQASQAHDKKKQMLKANKLTAEFYREMLKRASNDHPIKTYVQKRKLKPETLEEFQIGFSPQEWDGLANYLSKHGVSMALAEEAKLVKARKEGNGHFDLFRDRLMFPIHSASGEVLAFGGRIHDQGEPKYLNSPETFVFSKGKVLYGLAQTARHIRSEDCVVIVEGYMDLVSLFQAGLKNVAATMGTALTAEHSKLIKRMTPNVVVLFDGDEAGQMAAERSLIILLAQGLYPRGLVLTEAKDPDEFVNQFGIDALKKKIESTPDLFNVVLHMWMADYRGEASQKVKLVDKVRPVFEAIADSRLKSLYAEELAGRMNVTMEWLRSAFQKQTKQEFNAISRSQPLPNFVETAVVNSGPRTFVEGETQKIKLSDASIAEISLLQMALKSRANFEWLLALTESQSFKQILSQISHLGIRQILEKAEQVYRQDTNKFDKLFSLLIEKIDRPELLFQVSNSAANSTVEFDAEKEQKFLGDIITKIQQTFMKEQAKRMVLDIKQNVDVDKLKEFSDLQKSRLLLKK